MDCRISPGGCRRDVEGVVSRSAWQFAGWNFALPASRRARAAFCVGASARTIVAWPDYFSQSISLFAQSSGAEFGVAPRTDRSGERVGQYARTDLAHSSDGRATASGFARRHDQLCLHRGDSDGSAVRHPWDRTTGVESGAGARCSAAGESDDDRHLGYARGQFRFRNDGRNFFRERSMNWARTAAIVFLLVVSGACLLANFIAPAPYAHQFRDEPDAAPSRQHILGTDDLGRDRFSRVLYGTRVSLLLAPAAALLSSLMAAFIGGIAGFAGGRVERFVMAGTDLFLSLPWLFLLITVRAVLPLNVSPIVSVLITFAMLGCLGWAGAARIICADARALSRSDFILLARASGSDGFRLLRRHLVPNLKPVLYAQFWISVPVFILTEANLGILGLGVAEPLPSWGSLLRELEGFSSVSGQTWQLVPLILFILVVSSFHLVLTKEELPV